jgi:hypothetical protein
VDKNRKKSKEKITVKQLLIFKNIDPELKKKSEVGFWDQKKKKEKKNFFPLLSLCELE